MRQVHTLPECIEGPETINTNSLTASEGHLLSEGREMPEMVSANFHTWDIFTHPLRAGEGEVVQFFAVIQ
jgi:hypothetical protein